MALCTKFARYTLSHFYHHQDHMPQLSWMYLKIYNFLVGTKIFAVPVSYCETVDRLCLIGCEYFFLWFCWDWCHFLFTPGKIIKCRLHNKSYWNLIVCTMHKIQNYSTLTLSMGPVSKPHAKYSKNIIMVAW